MPVPLHTYKGSMIGIIGILFALLMYLAYRGFSVLLLAPLMAFMFYV
ncbi:MAG: hypothetical protein ACOH2K_05350 [Burkholderiaceae bacterium]